MRRHTGVTSTMIALFATAALLTSCVAGAAAQQPGGVAIAAKKKHKHHKGACASRKKKKKRQCQGGNQNQNQNQEGNPGFYPPVNFTVHCPTGTVSGSIPVTVTGTASPVPTYPVGIQYLRYDANQPYLVTSYGTVTMDSSGAWSFTFTPNATPWPYGNTWSEMIRVSVPTEVPGVDGVCSWQVSS